MKICDLTQFYSPVSGGVKRYISEKIAWMRRARPDDRHVLIIPGEQNACRDDGLARTYTIRSPLVSRTARYRALLNLTAVEEILEKERPDVIESGDPYQVAWKALASGDALGIPVVAFYHSHFPEAYLRTIDKFFGHIAVDITRDIARRYVRELYNRFAATIVPSPALARLLQDWGVRNTRLGELGVDTALFHAKADPDETRQVRAALDIADDQILLLYVGRLAPEKNVTTLFDAFATRCRALCPRGRRRWIGTPASRALARTQRKRPLAPLSGRWTAARASLPCGRSFRPPRRAGNLRSRRARKSGLGHAGRRHTRQLHGPHHLHRPGTLGGGKFPARLG
jgi:alpha-1,6-mannosyltransferase